MSTYHVVVMLKSKMIALDGDSGVRNSLVQFNQPTFVKFMQTLCRGVGRNFFNFVRQFPQFYR